MVPLRRDDAGSRCPCCGAASLPGETPVAPLLAVCDVLTLKALESMGKWIVRTERSRYRDLGDRPWHVAHTLWQPDDATVTKVLRGAWDVVPAMLLTYGHEEPTSVQIVAMLNGYVHDLVVTGTPHTLGELAYRFDKHLGVTLHPDAAVGRDSAAAGAGGTG